MVAEFHAAGERYPADEALLVQQTQGGVAPRQALWAVDVDSGEVVGASSLRHPLTPWMEEFGGHIGYRVRPSMRRRGHGSDILALTLEHAAALGMDSALILCEADNHGSIGVLRRNNARFERAIVVEGFELLRYRAATETLPGHGRPNE